VIKTGDVPVANALDARLQRDTGTATDFQNPIGRLAVQQIDRPQVAHQVGRSVGHNDPRQMDERAMRLFELRDDALSKRHPKLLAARRYSGSGNTGGLLPPSPLS